MNFKRIKNSRVIMTVLYPPPPHSTSTTFLFHQSQTSFRSIRGWRVPHWPVREGRVLCRLVRGQRVCLITNQRRESSVVANQRPGSPIYPIREWGNSPTEISLNYNKKICSFRSRYYAI